MAADPHPSSGKHQSRFVLFAAVPATLLVLLLLLLRGCPSTSPAPEPDDETLLVPRDLARRFDLPGILAYCRQEIRPAAYSGVLRGAHGALWAAEANAWDRVLLAAAALEAEGVEARVVPGEPPRLAYREREWTTVRLDVDQMPETAPDPPPGAIPATDLAATRPDLYHEIRPVLVFEAADGATRRIESKGPQLVAEWAYRPVVLTAEDGPRYILRVGEEDVLSSGLVVGVRRAVLELSWTFSGRTTTWVRELFDEANRAPAIPGRDVMRPGDRYAFVVAAGPLVPEVLHTRGKMLTSSRHTPLGDEKARQLVLFGTKYLVDSDDRSRQIAGETGVELAWATPRLVIAASEMPPAGAGTEAGLSLDTLSDRVEATGAKARQFHVARGMANDLIESRVVFEATQVPVVSASAVLSRYKADVPETPDRRLKLIASEAERLLSEEPAGTELILTAVPPRALNEGASSPDAPRLRVERASHGLVLHGVTEDQKTANLRDRYRWGGTGARFGRETGRLAAVADLLLARRVGRIDYLLRAERVPVWPNGSLPVVPGSVLTYRLRNKKTEHRLAVLISVVDGRIGGEWVDLKTGRHGDVAATWPRAVFVERDGPLVGAFVGTPPTDEGARSKVQVRVGDVQQEVEGRAVRPPRTPAELVEAEIGGSWFAAAVVRAESGKVLVRPVGSAGDNRWVESARVRPLKPVEFHKSNLPVWGNVLETKDGRHLVHECGRADSTREWVAATDIRPLRPAEVRRAGRWQEVNLLESKDGKHRVQFAHTGDAPEWLPENQVRPLDGTSGPPVEAVLLTGRFPLVLSWREESLELTLEAVSPVIRGQVNDADTGLPVAGATVAASDRRGRLRTAADGRFALPVASPLFRRVILILDRSGSMRQGFDPKGRGDAPVGQQRVDALRGAVETLLTKIPPGTEVAVWSFTTPDRYFGSHDDPKLTRVEQDFTTDLDRVRRVLRDFKPEGGTPITGAVARLLDHVRSTPQSRDAVVVLLTDGENTSKTSAAGLYRARNGDIPIHTIGFAVDAGGVAEKEMRELAEASGGTFRLAGSADQLRVTFERLGTEFGPVGLRIESSCHAPREVALTAEEVGGRLLNVKLVHGCSACRCGDRSLITVTGKSIADLAKCDGLSPKARQMIEDRVRGGEWVVTLPTSRTALGRITAYGWFETELATGRLVGRTEDGLHGSVADPSSWPPFLPPGVDLPGLPAPDPGHLPFIAWYEGIVSYTIGSVDAGLRWHREPGFMSGGPESLKRFVQAHALDYAAAWWAEVGAGAYPENMHSYWSGVCMNYVLQSAALGLPSDACHRRWAEAACNQATDKLKNVPRELWDQFKKENLGESWSRLVDDALKRGFKDLADEMKSAWEKGVDEGLDCRRLLGLPAAR